jgi:TonB family protein
VAQSKQTPVPQTPVPIHQIMPRFPAKLKSLLANNTAIEIQVNIDSDGKVVRAEPVPMQTAHRMLIQAALEAARSWKFRPAAIGATAVSSDMTLKFDFAPGRIAALLQLSR